MYQVTYLRKTKSRNKFLCKEIIFCVIPSKLLANVIAYLIDGFVSELKEEEISWYIELGKELEELLPNS